MRSIAFFVFAAGLLAADKYTGPRPPKPDVPYLLHANKLVETEAKDASNQQNKQGSVYMIAGAASPAKTPLAEPIFILESDKLNPGALELYRLEVKGGNREITIPKNTGRGTLRRSGGPKQYRLSYTKIGDRLFRIEASETLENGQYSLSPTDSDRAFCFEVY